MEQDKIKDYYAKDIEANRLDSEFFLLEGIRTKEIIERYLSKGNLQILDVGGGAGYYSFWLQSKGHQVTLLDLTPRNIELAQLHSNATGIKLSDTKVGDAVNLPFPDNHFDLVLLLGPLYHLTDRSARVKALAEAKRVLKQGGFLLAAVISRYASVFDGFQRDLVIDDQFFKLMTDDIDKGVHRNETNKLDYFTTAYFHTPAEIQSEVIDSGLGFDKLVAIESFGWIVKNFKEKTKDASYMDRLISTIRLVEDNQDLMAMSLHIMAVGKKA
ncbi:MAG TPA: class I SAM-dependent methyltransferase [Cyclobacteriaceae bacterium]|nr:class I SAM-dependent methyltransferase [Cyclobacteriaceae bacterium]